MQVGDIISGKFLNVSKEQTALVYLEDKVDETGFFTGDKPQVAFIKLAKGINPQDALAGVQQLQFEIVEAIEDKEDLFKMTVHA